MLGPIFTAGPGVFWSRPCSYIQYLSPFLVHDTFIEKFRAYFHFIYFFQTPSITKKHMNTCIRAMCNSDIKKEGFTLGKDVPLPETLISSPKNPLREFGGKPASERSTLAFFAGRMHGDVRPILLQHWQNKDPDMKIFGKLPKSKHNINYINYMKSSKYCICAKGYEVVETYVSIFQFNFYFSWAADH
ncbi:putative xylogalacturonan beta-1,3-xylosyltransferase [Helianthus annuus]|nr:putative xylogalacturonan beta-1,3-xylosyltransferase [Helianthus annuus]